jgi:hypothetical protein
MPLTVLESDFTSFLEGNAPLVALRGDRVYPDILPQNPTLPAQTYVRIVGISEVAQTGPSQLAHCRMQLSSWGKTYGDAKTLAETSRQVLAGFKGTMGSTVIQGIFVLDTRDLYQDEPKQYRTDYDFEIWYEEI